MCMFEDTKNIFKYKFAPPPPPQPGSDPKKWIKTPKTFSKLLNTFA